MKLALIPLKSELKYFLKSLEKKGFQPQKFQHQGFWFYNFKDLDLTCALGGHGKAKFALQTQFCISYLQNITHLFGLGSAGGLSPKLSVGDLVCATKIIEHDYILKFDQKASLKDHLVDTEFLSILQKKSDLQKNFKVHFGAIASGDEDIASKQRAQELFKKTKALAVAWEPAGGVRTAKFNGLCYTEIRGITDNARSDVAEDFKKNLPQVMEHIAEFMIFILKVKK